MIGSPGTGEQHLESRTSTSSTPAMRMPDALRATRRVEAGRGSVCMSTTLSVLSSSLRRLATEAALASPKPIAAYRSFEVG
jgi:hypothetical protein